MKRLTVDKGLLRETEMVQKQIWALLRCDVSRQLYYDYCCSHVANSLTVISGRC